MLVIKLLVVLCAISATQSIFTLYPYIGSIITRVMSKLNSLDSATHDVALVHYLGNETDRSFMSFINEVCDAVTYYIPPQNPIVRASMGQKLVNFNLRRADITIMVTYVDNVVSQIY
jgi:hypothetical protein